MKRSFNCGSGDATIWVERRGDRHIGTLKVQIDTGNVSPKDLKKLLNRLSTWLQNASAKVP
jgi:hypothetical protein